MMPMFHIAGVGLVAGRAVLRLPDGRAARRRSRPRSCGSIPEYGITNAFMVPAVIQFLLMTPGRRVDRLLDAAGPRLRRLADHRRRAGQGHGDVRLRVHPGLRAHRDDRRDHPARRRRPRPGGPAAPAALVRQAVPVGRGADRRRRDRRGRADRRGRRAVDPLAPEHGRLLEQPGGDGRGRSPPTAGSGPATPATSTPTASCSCTTG